MHLGSRLGPPKALLGSRWTLKASKKSKVFLRCLQMQVFVFLKLSMSLFGSSRPLFLPIWSQNGPQNCLQNGPKVVQQMVQNRTPQNALFKLILGPEISSKGTVLARPRLPSCALRPPQLAARIALRDPPLPPAASPQSPEGSAALSSCQPA